MNYYDVLNIPVIADKQEIKRAYFTAVKLHTPDADPEGFKSVRLAYETLSDNKKRVEYDNFLNTSHGDSDLQNELLTARELFTQNKYKAASELLSELSIKNPDHTEVNLLYTDSLRLIRKTGTAENVLKKILAREPKNAKALLLRGKISFAKGHVNKAEEYYCEAVKCDPNNPHCWIGYIKYLIEQKSYKVNNTIVQAIDMNENIFCNEYIFYLYPIKKINKNVYDAQPLLNSKKVYKYFEKFIEFFIVDKNYTEHNCIAAISVITGLVNIKEFLPLINKILPFLLDNKFNETNEDIKITLSKISILAKTLDFRTDKRIHENVLDYVMQLFIDVLKGNDKLLTECSLVMNIHEIRSSVTILRAEYPELYKLNTIFFNDILNRKKEEYLINKYRGIFKKVYPTKKDILFNNDDYDDLDEFYNFNEDNDIEIVKNPNVPFVHETPKISPNAPCPCGSGKKYKKCCRE